MENPLYVNLRKTAEFVPNQPLLLRDIAGLWRFGGVPKIVEDITIDIPSNQPVYPITAEWVAGQITTVLPHLPLSFIGESCCWAKIEKPRRKTGVFANFGAILIALLLFAGAAGAIISFHGDVDMIKAHQAIYHMFTGKHTDNSPWVSVPYSIGVGLGVALFFLRFGKKRLRRKPSPIEVQNDLMQHEILQYQQTRFEEEQRHA